MLHPTICAAPHTANEGYFSSFFHSGLEPTQVSYTHNFTHSFFHSYIILYMHISFLHRQLFHLHTAPSFSHSSFGNSAFRTLIFSILSSTIIRNTSLLLSYGLGPASMELHVHIHAYISSSIHKQFFIHSNISLLLKLSFSILLDIVP